MIGWLWCSYVLVNVEVLEAWRGVSEKHTNQWCGKKKRVKRKFRILQKTMFRVKPQFSGLLLWWPCRKASTSKTGDKGIEPCFHQSPPSHTSDFDISTNVATLLGVGCFGDSARTGMSESLCCDGWYSKPDLQLLSQSGSMYSCLSRLSLRYTSMLLGHQANNQQQQPLSGTNNKKGPCFNGLLCLTLVSVLVHESFSAHAMS